MISYFSDGFRDILVDPYTYEGQPLLWVCLGISLVTLFAMFCYRNLSQKVSNDSFQFPSNFIAFFIFTLSFSFLVAGCCAVCYDLFDNGGLIVLSASLLTLAITLALTLYAWTTKKDFTLCGINEQYNRCRPLNSCGYSLDDVNTIHFLLRDYSATLHLQCSNRRLWILPNL